MSEQTDQVVILLAERVEQAEKQIGELLEMIQSLQRNLTNAFKEAGYDFEKIARIESSRRRDAVKLDVDAILNPEEIDPTVQDEIAKKILADHTEYQVPYSDDGDYHIPNHVGDTVKILPPVGQDGDIRDPRAAVNDASNKGRKQ